MHVLLYPVLHYGRRWIRVLFSNKHLIFSVLTYSKVLNLHSTGVSDEHSLPKKLEIQLWKIDLIRKMQEKVDGVEIIFGKLQKYLE